MNLEKIIFDLISKKKEGNYWDFKQIPHDNNASLLIDIICLANSLHKGDKYLIFGVTDDGEIEGLNAEHNRKNQKDYIDYLSSKSFAGDIRPNIELHSLEIEGKKIDILVIKDENQKPYFITEKYKDRGEYVNGNVVYSRIGNTNTPKDKGADIYLVEKMWKQRFGIDLSAVERMDILLTKPNEWINKIDSKGYTYNSIFPEFRIEFSEPKQLEGETFQFFFINERAFHGMARFYYHTTVLFEIEYVYCDEMRILYPYPSICHIRIDNKDNWYYYFDLSSKEGVFFYFLTDLGKNIGSGRGEDVPFLLFKDKYVQEKFNLFLKFNKNLYGEIDGSCNLAEKRMNDYGVTSSISPIFISKTKNIYGKWIEKTFRNEGDGRK